jgi:hypothetical protein
MGMAAAALMMTAAMPAFAQDDAALDALLDGSETPDAALSLARKQAREGDLMGAAATLERALLTHSKNVPEVRLYYAATLCKLGDRQTALSEVSRSGKVDADSPAWAETRAACGDVALPASEGFSVGGEISVGLAFDSDLARSLLVEYNLPGYPAVPGEEGFSFIESARINFRAPSGGAFFYGGASGTTKNPLSGSSPHFQVADAVLGIGAPSGNAEFSIGGVLRHARIGGDPFVTEMGGEAMVSFAMGPNGRLSLRGEVVQQDFMGSTALFSRDGMRYDIGLSYSEWAGTTRYWAGIAYEGKDAETQRTGYSGARIAGSVRKALTPRGTYTSLSSMLRYVQYDQAVGFPAANETRFLGRAALGSPLVPGIDIEAAGSYSSRNYNAASRLKSYENYGAELRLVWTFGN